ncbi:type II toxin-antitoxin system HicB family antitoxin [Candidatus Spongiihabitans sp.]|uniref:type II toxin-antitoxin system HicB family antitoxin n=1 Tax=Candidatus Spongiihabitans sp. TaxID=3101308 RepID=UPI003C7D0746
MKIKVVVHKAEEGGFWAEVPSIPGCVSQGDTMKEIKINIEDAILGCLSIDIEEPEVDEEAEVIELAV